MVQPITGVWLSNSRPQTPDIFVHTETLRRRGFTELRPGQTVLVRYGRGPNGLIAVELKPDNAPGPSSH
jgi:cold shock protein